VALSLADGVARPPAQVEDLMDARQRLAGWLTADVCESPADERKRFGSLIDRLSDESGGLGDAVNPAYAVTVSSLLSLPDYDLEWAEHIVAEHDRHGLFLTDTEKHVLSTLMAFFDD
jgi:hypothetical protein